MPYIISPNKTSLDLINKKINDWMKTNIEGYNAIRWGDVTKHPINEAWALKINIDERNPLGRLTNSEKLQLIDKLDDTWFKEPT